MGMITLDQLKRLFPNAPARCELFCQPLNDAMAAAGIATPARAGAFLAQVGHESGRLVYTRELWGPTAAQRGYEPPSAKAQALGNTQPGDGFRYRGRGLIQITGRANYAKVGAALLLPLIDQPELLEQPGAACASAAWFWKTAGLNELADKGLFRSITLRINGGLNGYDDRLDLWAAAKKILGVG
ncbi:glycoside hydrolase family 19 protein [Chromobacterium violaceum]|uniref:glycoside hydrolase family 19 protein n=1 Tax=Chromobacterium violaceum TaxID=536 RepID=UPI001CE0F99F|nr:glycoside hydrolase family 19 protein [Chromobacterium violaceum]